MGIKYRPIGIMKHGWKYFYALWALLYFFLGPIALLFPPVLAILLCIAGFALVPLFHEGWTEWRKRMAKINDINSEFGRIRKQSKETRMKSGSYKRMMSMKKKM